MLGRVMSASVGADARLGVNARAAVDRQHIETKTTRERCTQKALYLLTACVTK